VFTHTSFTVHLAPIPMLFVRNLITPHHYLNMESGQNIASSVPITTVASNTILRKTTRDQILSAERAFHRLIPSDVGSVCSSSNCAVACSQIIHRTLVFASVYSTVYHPLERLITPLSRLNTIFQTWLGTLLTCDPEQLTDSLPILQCTTPTTARV
jgi:hypothetical protein